MRTLQHDGPPPWEAREIIDEIWGLRVDFHSLSFGWVRRSSNGVAHGVASWMNTRTHDDSVELHDIPTDILT